MDLHILGYRCKKCGHEHYPNRTLCPKCGHELFESFPLPTQGKLLTYTHLHTLPVDFEVSSITLGMVELENGLRITGQLNIEKPKIGMKVTGEVTTVREDEYTQNLGMVFFKS